MRISHLLTYSCSEAIITIKSSANCSITKRPLTRDEYVSSRAFGLSQSQREQCYDLFIKYERWREYHKCWDESDRVMYVIKHGPSVYNDVEFISWSQRVRRYYDCVQEDILDDEGGPLYPFFFDMVYADESQDFVSDCPVHCVFNVPVQASSYRNKSMTTSHVRHFTD